MFLNRNQACSKQIYTRISSLLKNSFTFENSWNVIFMFLNGNQVKQTHFLTLIKKNPFKLENSFKTKYTGKISLK